MTEKEVLDDLKTIIVERLRFDPARAAEMTLDTTLPKGVDGSLGSTPSTSSSCPWASRALGIVIDEREDLSGEFLSSRAWRASSCPSPRRDDPGRSPRVVVSGSGREPVRRRRQELLDGPVRGRLRHPPGHRHRDGGAAFRVAAEVPAEVLVGSGVAPPLEADRLALAAAAGRWPTRGSRPDRRQAACLVGAVGGGMHEDRGVYWDEVRAGGPRPGRRALRSVLPRAHADAVAFRFGLEGPRETLVMACASGAASIALGADLIRDGVVDVALVGGVDALTRICFMGFNALKLLDPSRAVPSTATAAACPSAGAAFLVLEEAGRCRARGGAHAPSWPARH